MQYGLQNRALAYTKEQAIKGLKMTSVKTFKQKTNDLVYIKNEKLETLMHHFNEQQPLNISFLT